jgi:Protein of unknown function (DUF3386)
MTVTQLSAQELFRAAYDNRYTWDQNFPGYTADITFRYDNTVITGQVIVNAELKAEVLGVEDESAKKAIHGQAWEIAIHRVRRTFEATHGANTFRYGTTDENGAVEILMGGKAEGDRYKVHNNIVTLVHRRIHGVVVTINTFGVQETGEGYLPHTYDSVYHDPTTGEQKGGVSNFVDEYEKVGGYFVLNRREISTNTGGKTSVQEFVFSNIKFLEPIAA